MTLKEPTKAELAAGGVPRRAFAHVYDRTANRLYEVVADPAAQTVLSWTAKPAGTQPAVWGNEFDEGDAVVRADPRFATKMAARGINPTPQGLHRRLGAGRAPARAAGRPATASCARSSSTGARCRTRTTARSRA